MDRSMEDTRTRDNAQPEGWEGAISQFSLASFRPGQHDVIASVMRGEDCICVMPTGGGKSLCYQLPAVVRPGLCLVVSPLIALMKDQVDQLQQRGLRAELLNSTLNPEEQERRLQQVRDQQLDLLYVAPERFRSPRFEQVLRESQVQLFAVDEAHCISEWGHDFRHDYSRLGEYRRRWGNPQTIALTATATQEVREDIATQLGLEQFRTFVAGFERPNLFYTAVGVGSQAEKLSVLDQFLRENPGAGILYASSRRACEDVAATLSGSPCMLGRRVAVYHAGLPLDRRKEVQESFMAGSVDVIVATNAFGMGIDKPDVRFVVHYQIPGTLEAYYQEAGRAGRDGLPARCLLLLSDSDRYIQEFFIESTHPSAETIAEIYEYLRRQTGDPIEMTQQELQSALDLSISAEGVGTCERILEKHGVLERLEPQSNMAAVRLDSDLPSLVDLLPRQARVQRQVMRAVEQVVGARRFERVYLRPEGIAKRLEAEPTTVQRALRELRQLDAFDYVPPFRGRAVHLLRRDVPFTGLGLDLRPLEARRKVSLQKLDEMFRYARSNRCRQQQVLRYFGETDATSCGHCDNCQSHGPAAQTQHASLVGDPCIHRAVLMVLSGVARCRGKFGKTIVAGMLSGSQAKKIQRWDLHRLSTFGLLKPMKQADIVEFIDELIAERLLETSDVERHRPTLRLTELGDQVMRGKANWSGDLQLPGNLLQQIVYSVGRQAPHADACDGDERENETHGNSEVVAATEGEAATERIPIADHGGNESLPGFYWTCRLLEKGFTLPEASAIRGRSIEDVWEDLMSADREGFPVANLDGLTDADRRRLSVMMEASPSQGISSEEPSRQEG